MNEIPSLIIVGWLLFCAGLLLIVPREMSPHAKLYRSKKRFLKQHKEYTQIVKYFELFRILWIIGSFVAMAILMQDKPAEQFLLFVLLVPAVGVGIVQSLLEMYYGLSLQVGGNHNNKTIIIAPLIPRIRR